MLRWLYPSYAGWVDRSQSRSEELPSDADVPEARRKFAHANALETMDEAHVRTAMPDSCDTMMDELHEQVRPRAACLHATLA